MEVATINDQIRINLRAVVVGIDVEMVTEMLVAEVIVGVIHEGLVVEVEVGTRIDQLEAVTRTIMINRRRIMMNHRILDL